VDFGIRIVEGGIPLESEGFVNSKIPNLKHLNTNKSQYSMTETITKIVSCCIASPGLSAMLLPDTTEDGLIVWYFEFGSLEFV
jgi:hypothetical protein